MAWLHNAVPNVWQWIGLFVTILGTGMAIWAALSAKGAKRQAREAKEAAIRLGHVLQLSDLLQDLQEMETMLARQDFESIAMKASHLRGRIVRFKEESYNLLGEDVAKELDLAREQLTVLVRVCVNWTGKPENRSGKIQEAIATAAESLNRVFAMQRAKAHGD